MNRFGKDQHELLVCQLFHIHQSASVQEYIDKFTRLVDQLIAYGRNTDPIYYAMRFVDGLRTDIRAAIHMQRPQNLDTACVLALLQEELVDPTRKKELRRPKPFTFARAPVRGPMPLPHPQPWQERPDRPMNPNLGPERRGHGVDDKLSTLRDYRRAHGLCVRCGEKWSRDHRCPEAIQLHALQELWEVCFSRDCQEDGYDDSLEADTDEAQLCIAISMAASGSPPSVTSIQFMGHIQGHPVRILIDSGSSHTFVSAALAAQLQGQSVLSPTLKVMVADGS